MKQIFLFISFLFIFNTSFSQDYIYLLNGKKVASTVLEISKEKIRYHAADDPEGLVREVASREVYMISYRNGKEEIFGIEKPRRQEKYFSNEKNEYYALSMGIGQSHGFSGDLGISFNFTRPRFVATMVAVDFGFIYRFPGRKK